NFGNPSLATALNGPSTVTWTSSGDATWYGQTQSSHDGASAARSGPVGYDPTFGYQSSFLQTTVSGPGIVRFWWKTGDLNSQMTFTIDQASPTPTIGQNYINGVTDWTLVVVKITDLGNHVLQWSYFNGDTSQTLNAGWVDTFWFGKDGDNDG